MLLEPKHQFVRLGFGMHSQDTGQGTEFADPLSGTLHKAPAVDGLGIGPEICIAVQCHEAEEMERAVIAEFPVVVEVPEPFLQNTHFGKAGKLAFLGALHFGTSLFDDCLV